MSEPEFLVDMYDVTKPECLADYECDGCGADDKPRLLQIEGKNGILLLCYDGCVQQFGETFSELVMPEEEGDSD